MKSDIEKLWNSKVFQNECNEAIEIINDFLLELNEKYKEKKGIDFIRFRESRIKSVDSICAKLERKDHEVTTESMYKHLTDICGVRVICFSIAQVYKIASMIGKAERYELVKVKDYVRKPKDNGYQSYHIVVAVTVSDGEIVNVEIQIRTILMDAWASLDTSMRYKKKKNISAETEEKIEKLSNSSAKMDKIITSIMKEYKKED